MYPNLTEDQVLARRAIAYWIWGIPRRSRAGGNLDPEAAPLPLD